jgi:hypothetical protein
MGTTPEADAEEGGFVLLDGDDARRKHSDDLMRAVATVIKERYNMDVYTMDKTALTKMLRKSLGSSSILADRRVKAALTWLLLRSSMTQVMLNLVFPSVLRMLLLR